MTIDIPDENQLTLVAFEDRVTDYWTITQANLPAVTTNVTATLTITVSGGEPSDANFLVGDVILLDDIRITQGQCPEFSE